MLVLVVEDELQITEILEMYLRQEGYQTERATRGDAAMALFRASKPDLVVLDIMLPGMNGLDVLKAIRQESSTPVILLTARAEESDRIVGLELGADDYVVKPFRPREVMARVKAVLRRSHPPVVSGQSRVLRCGILELDPQKVTVKVADTLLNFTPAEYKLLLHLLLTPGRVFSRNELLEHALPESGAMERVVDAHLASVRRKLEQSGATGFLQTVRGLGYRIQEP